MADAFDLTRTVRNLLNIQVNTIIRDAMTGDEMPPVPHALLDIAEEYADVLCNLGLDLPTVFGVKGGVPPEGAPLWVKPPANWVGASLRDDADTFEKLRWSARWALNSNSAAGRLTGPKRVVLNRIVNNCDTIKEMFKRFEQQKQLVDLMGKTRSQLNQITLQDNSYKISMNDLITLQKIWDIGTEEIVAQTVVHLSGDVTTRIQSVLREPGADPLFAIHRQSVDVSVTRWRDLLDAIKEIAGAAIGKLLGAG